MKKIKIYSLLSLTDIWQKLVECAWVSSLLLKIKEKNVKTKIVCKI